MDEKDSLFFYMHFGHPLSRPGARLPKDVSYDYAVISETMAVEDVYGDDSKETIYILERLEKDTSKWPWCRLIVSAKFRDVCVEMEIQGLTFESEEEFLKDSILQRMYRAVTQKLAVSIANLCRDYMNF